MSTEKKFAGQTALVTGASSGIGLELARLCAEDGHDLVLVARSKDKLEALAAELRAAHGVKVLVVPADLAEPKAPQAVFDAVARAGVAVDVVINNAGYGVFGRFADETSIADELAMLQVNIVALTHLSKLFVAGMVARQRGRILNVASTAAFQAGPLMACYYASKAYVLSLSEALARELQDSGVSVTVLCPGPTESGFQDVAKMKESKLVAGKKLATSRSVALAGYRAMLAGKVVHVPGAANKVMAASVRFTPRPVLRSLVYKIQQRREPAPS